MLAAKLRDRSWQWGPLVALLLVGAARWLVIDTHPEAGPTLGSEALGCAWAALLVWAFSGRGERERGSRWKTMVAGALMLGGPLTVLMVRAPLVDASGVTMSLALTPVVLAVASAALSRGESEDVVGRLWPGLAAVAGLLLVMVTPALSDVRSDAVLAAAPLLTGIGGALFCAEAGGRAWKMRMALTGAALVFAGLAAVWWGIAGRPGVSMMAVAWDGVLALLGVAVLAQLGATRWGAQFVLLPLLVLLEGIVLVRPAMTVRWVCGLVLLAVASVYLLLPRDEAAE